MLPNVAWRMVQRLSVACLLVLSFRGEIAAQETSSPTVAPSTSIAPTATEVPTVTAPSCYSNLTTLYDDQQAGNIFVEKIYTLCPNTTFVVGVSDGQGGCCSEGQLFLSPRRNTRTQCGEDGKSSNNCVIVGGESQVIFLEMIEDEGGANVEFAGITFEDASLVTAFLGNAGDVSFTDCVFRVSKKLCPCFVRRFNPFPGTNSIFIYRITLMQGSFLLVTFLLHPSMAPEGCNTLPEIV
jgi:hypothetical protein